VHLACWGALLNAPVTSTTALQQPLSVGGDAARAPLRRHKQAAAGRRLQQPVSSQQASCEGWETKDS